MRKRAENEKCDVGADGAFGKAPLKQEAPQIQAVSCKTAMIA
jgi:hypothetical protein